MNDILKRVWGEGQSKGEMVQTANDTTKRLRKHHLDVEDNKLELTHQFEKEKKEGNRREKKVW